MFIINGFAGLHQFLGVVVNILTEYGFEVMTYDHRGLGQSVCPRGPQTTAMLATDALLLVDRVWGCQSTFHVVGISMGGMVAQELLAMLAKQQQQRAVSATLVCTSPGRFVREPPLLRWMIAKIAAADVHRWSLDKQMNMFMPKLFHPSFMEEPNPHNPLETRGEVLTEWMRRRWTDFLQLNCSDLFAAQFCAAQSHYLSPEKARLIRGGGCRVCVVITQCDAIFPLTAQRQLATLIGSTVLEYESGHMDMFVMDNLDRFMVDYCVFIEEVSKVQSAAQQAAARAAEAEAMEIPAGSARDAFKAKSDSFKARAEEIARVSEMALKSEISKETIHEEGGRKVKEDDVSDDQRLIKQLSIRSGRESYPPVAKEGWLRGISNAIFHPKFPWSDPVLA